MDSFESISNDQFPNEVFTITDKVTRSKTKKRILPIYESIVVESRLPGSKQKKFNNRKVEIQSDQTHQSIARKENIFFTGLDESLTARDDSKSLMSPTSGIDITLQDTNIEFETLKPDINSESNMMIWNFVNNDEDEAIQCDPDFRIKLEEIAQEDPALDFSEPNPSKSLLCRNSMRHLRNIKQINDAIKDIKENDISARRAAHIHGIKLNVLLSSMAACGSKSKGVIGPDPALTENEEEKLVNWIKTRYQSGFPVKKIDLIHKAADVVHDGRHTRFKDGIPGEKWFMNFMMRHPNVASLGPVARADSRTNPTKRSLSTWFKNCLVHLKAFGQENLLKDPTKVGTAEELILCLNNSCANVSTKTNVERIYMPDESAGYLTTLVGACADGVLMPPLPIFSCRRPSADLVNSVPHGWGIGLCRNGKVNKDVIYSYLKNILISWLIAKDRLPFILFVDNLKEHLTVDIADFCADKGLLMYNFYPQSYNVLQPLYSSIMGPIKHAWNYVSPYNNEKEALLSFSGMLNSLLESTTSVKTIRQSFKNCGIFPFDPSAPDYKKCQAIANNEGTQSRSNSDFVAALEVLEETMGEKKIEFFRGAGKGQKTLKTADVSLYKLWFKLTSQVDATSRGNRLLHDYHHEKILKAKGRNVPRPDTYLMVVSDDEDDPSATPVNSYCNYSFNVLPKAFAGEASANRHFNERTQNEIGITLETVFSEVQYEDSVTQCFPVDVWKKHFTSYKSKFLDLPIKSEVSRKARHSSSPSDTDSPSRSNIKSESDICCSCFEAGGRTVACISCRKISHFDCLVSEERSMVSFLMEDKSGFDYLCPTCSAPDCKS